MAFELPANGEANAAVAAMILSAVGADAATYELLDRRLMEIYPNQPQSVAAVLWSASMNCKSALAMGIEEHRRLLVKVLLTKLEPAAEAVAAATAEEEEEEEESEEEA
jgi:hypothetical protein